MKRTILVELQKLPDRMPIGELEKLFRYIVFEYNVEKMDKSEFFHSLIQLTDRQVLTYEWLEPEIRKQLDNMLSELWNTESYEEVDMMLTIVVNLGLESCFSRMKQSVLQGEKMDETTRREIVESINEVGDHISDPYYHLDKYR